MKFNFKKNLFRLKLTFQHRQEAFFGTFCPSFDRANAAVQLLSPPSKSGFTGRTFAVIVVPSHVYWEISYLLLTVIVTVNKVNCLHYATQYVPYW